MRNEISYNNLTWIDIQNPKPRDVRFLQESFSFHEIVLEELIPHSHRPKVENHGDYLFMVLYYPAFSKKKNETFPRELDILVTKTHLLTSHYRTILPLKSLFDHINLYEESRKEYMSEGTGQLLFYLIRGVLENALTKLERIEEEVDYIEEEIFKGKEREMVFEISETQRDIIDFRRILAPQRTVIESLATEGVAFFGKEVAPHLEDLRGNFMNIWNELEEHRETLAALAETNRSLLSTKTNEIIKVLTLFSTIFLPLTLMASIWGMNIEAMPLSQSREHFWVLVGGMSAIAAFMIGYFVKKKWL